MGGGYTFGMRPSRELGEFKALLDKVPHGEEERHFESLPESMLFYAKAGNRPIGALTLCKSDRHRLIVLSRIAVDKGHRGKGVATRLLIMGLEHFKGSNMPVMSSKITDRTGSMEKMLKKLGFQYDRKGEVTGIAGRYVLRKI